MELNCGRCSILIVEDELLVRKALRYIIEQEKAFEITGEATNGEEALEIMERSLPHIIICDIRMPRMNGLELLHAVNLKYPEVSAIILSGYQDFEYVKSAFKYGVVDYILKPELESDYLLKTLGAIGRKKGLIHTVAAREGEESGRFRAKACTAWYLIAIRPGEFLLGAANKQELTIGHMGELIRKSFGRLVVDSFILKRNQVYVYVVGSFYPRMFEEKLEGLIGQAADCLRNIEMIISSLYDRKEGLEAEAQRISELFSYRFFDSGREWLDLRKDGRAKLPALDQKAVCELVRQQKAGAAGAMLAGYLNALRGLAVSELSVKKLMESTLYNTIFELSENGFCPPQLEERKMSFLTAVGAADSLDGLIGAVSAVYGEIGNIMGGAHENGLYLRITEYLYRHYSEPVTLKTLAGDFNVNYTYLSACFSSHMGQGFNECLNSIRVERAKELLAVSNHSLSEIAQEVGYTDQSYFGRVFKKQTGYSPHVYRNKAAGQEKRL